MHSGTGITRTLLKHWSVVTPALLTYTGCLWWFLLWLLARHFTLPHVLFENWILAKDRDEIFTSRGILCTS